MGFHRSNNSSLVQSTQPAIDLRNSNIQSRGFQSVDATLIEALLGLGFSKDQLSSSYHVKELGQYAKALLDLEFTKEQLLSSSYYVEALGQYAKTLLDLGFTKEQLLSSSYYVENLGQYAKALLDLGFTKEQLLSSSYSVRALATYAEEFLKHGFHHQYVIDCIGRSFLITPGEGIKHYSDYCVKKIKGFNASKDYPHLFAILSDVFHHQQKIMTNLQSRTDIDASTIKDARIFFDWIKTCHHNLMEVVQSTAKISVKDEDITRLVYKILASPDSLMNQAAKFLGITPEEIVAKSCPTTFKLPDFTQYKASWSDGHELDLLGEVA